MRSILALLLLLALVAQGWLATVVGVERWDGAFFRHARLASFPTASSCRCRDCGGRTCCATPQSSRTPVSPALPAPSTAPGSTDLLSLPAPLSSLFARIVFPPRSPLLPLAGDLSAPAPGNAPDLFLRDCSFLI